MTPKETQSLFSNSAFCPAASNPFLHDADAQASGTGAVEAAPARADYALLRTGPPVRPDEVEDTARDVVEIGVAWGNSVILAKHIPVGTRFVLATEAGPGVDLVLPVNALAEVGLERWTLLDGRCPPCLLRPAGISGYEEQLPASAGSSQEAGSPATVRQLSGGGSEHISLSRGNRTVLELGMFTVRVALVPAPRRVPRAALDLAVAPYLALTTAVLGGFLLSLLMAMPPRALRGAEEVDAQRLQTMRAYLEAHAERDRKQPTLEPAEQAAAPADGGEHHTGKSGKAGRTDSPRKAGRLGVEGAAPRESTRLSRAEALRLARSFGMIAVLAREGASRSNAPTSLFATARDAVGADPLSAHGQLFGQDINDAAGAGGLGLANSGLGGGGDGRGIGIGPGRGIGPGVGFRTGPGFWGPGGGRGRPGGGRRSVRPELREARSEVTGRIAASVIQRVVRQNFGRFRACYQSGLTRNAELAGTVSVSFAVTPGGTVQLAGAGGSLPDSQVVGCVANAFSTLSFPSPGEGIVRVTYPLSFSPS